MNSNKNLHNSLSKKMLAKKLLLAILAATSTLTALDASASSAVVAGGIGRLSLSTNIFIDGAVTTGAQITKDHDLYIAHPGTHIFDVADITLKAVNALGNTSTLEVLENAKVESIVNNIDDATIAKANTGRSTVGVAHNTDKLVLSGGANAFGIGTDKLEQITVQFSALKTFEVTGKDVSGLKEVDFFYLASTFKISGNDTVISDKVSFKSSGGDQGIVEINATGVALSAKFNDTANMKVKTIKVNEGKSAIQKTDVKLSGSLDLAKGAIYDIDAGKKFEGSAVTFVDVTSTLNLKGGNTITGAVGNDATKGVVTHTGKASTITGDVTAKSLKLDSQEEALIITGTLDENTVITATGSAKLELQNAASKITPFTIIAGNTATQTPAQTEANKKVAEAEKAVEITKLAQKTAEDALAAGKTDAKLTKAAEDAKSAKETADKNLADAKDTANKAAATATTATVALKANGQFETKGTLTQNVLFSDAGAVLKVKDGDQLKGVTTETNDTGEVFYLGDAVISADIGTETKALKSIKTDKEKGKITINEGIKVYGDVRLVKSEQILDIGKGALVWSVFAEAATKDHRVNVGAGASLGDVKGDATASGIVNFTGGGKFIGKDYVATKFNLIKGEGEAVFLVDNGGKNITLTNLVTQKGVTIDAGDSLLTFAPDATIANNTTYIADGTDIKLPLVNDALNVKGQEAKNIGQTNIIINFDKVAENLNLTGQTYKELTDKEKNKSGPAIKLITGIKNLDVSKKFTLNENKTYNLNTKFENEALTIDPTFNASFVDETKGVSIIDPNAKLTDQDVLLFKLIEEKGQDEAIREVSAMNGATGGSIILSNISIALQNQINNQMNNRNVSGGENYNEMGIAAFVAPFMSGGTSKLNGQVAGNKHSSSGANFGATFGLNDDKTHFGLAITIAKSDTKYKDAQEGNKLKSDTKAFTIFGNHSFANNLVVQGVFTFGATDNKANQLSGDKILSGKYSSKFSSVLAKLGYNINAGDSVKVMPYVGLSYDSIKDDSYKLVNNSNAKDIAKRDVAGKTTNSYNASIGTKFSGEIEYDETNLVPFADLSFGYNFGKKASAKEVSLGNLLITPEYATHDKSSIRASQIRRKNTKHKR